MILYIFQCHFPKSSHPLPLPQSPKDCSIHQCLFPMPSPLPSWYLFSLLLAMGLTVFCYPDSESKKNYLSHSSLLLSKSKHNKNPDNSSFKVCLPSSLLCYSASTTLVLVLLSFIFNLFHSPSLPKALFLLCHSSVANGSNFLLSVEVLVSQWCPTSCNPRDCSLPGSSVHGILQARILE